MKLLLLAASFLLAWSPLSLKAQTADTVAANMLARTEVKENSYKKRYWIAQIGANLSHIGGDSDSVANKMGLAASIGLGVDWSESLSFQGSLAFNSQGARIESDWAYIGLQTGAGSALNAIYSYISLPLAVQYYPSTKHGFFLEGALQPSFLLKAQLTGIGGDFAANKSRIDMKGNMRPFDLGVGAGIGYRWEKGLDVRLKYLYGTGNTIDNSAAGSADGRYANRTVQLSLGYRFR